MKESCSVNGFCQYCRGRQRAMQADPWNTHFFNRIPKRMCIVRKGRQRKINPAKATMKRFGYLCQFLPVLFNFTTQVVSTLLQTFCMFKCLDCQIRGLGCNGKFGLVTIMVGSWQEGCACLYICQRCKLKIG